MFGDTGSLSFQLDMYRWEDHLRRMEHIRERGIDQETSDVVIAKYNELVQHYNSLAEAAVRAGAAAEHFQDQVRSKDQEIAELKQELNATRADAKHKLDNAWTTSRNYLGRALDAEGELARLRSQQD